MTGPRETVVRWALGALNALVPKRREKVVVHSRPDGEDGALAVIDELLARGYRPIVLSEQRIMRANPVAPGVRAFPKNSARGRYHFLTAQTIITTHGPYRRHRIPRSQRVLNIWHGEPLAKSMGRLHDEEPVPCTWVTAMSTVGRAFRCAEFGVPPSRVLITGAPRNDRLLDADRQAVRKAVLAQGDESLAVWLPTYRHAAKTGRHDGSPFRGVVPMDDPDLRKLDGWLEQNRFVLLAKSHPIVTDARLDGYRYIRMIDSEWLREHGLTLYPFLWGVDCLITDASTVWLDFLLTDRPIIFHFPDLEAYRTTRGLNLEPFEHWAPGPLTRDVDGLIAELQALADGRDAFADARRAAKGRLHRYADPNSTQRTLDAVGLTGARRAD